MNYNAATNGTPPQQDSQSNINGYLSNPSGLFNDPNHPNPSGGISPLGGSTINPLGPTQQQAPAQPAPSQTPTPIQAPSQAPVPDQITPIQPKTQSGDMLTNAMNNFAALPNSQGAGAAPDSSQGAPLSPTPSSATSPAASDVAPISTPTLADQGLGVQAGAGLQMDPQAVAQQAQTASKSNNISGLQNVATKYATSAVLNYVNNREAAAVMNSRQDQQTWQDNAAKFLSPNSDIKPDLDAYLRTQPLATDALSESTLTGGNMSKTAGGRGALGVLSGGLSALMPSGEAEYAFNKGGEGAAQGAVAGGWVGAIVGGVVGVAEGIVGWGDASAKDNAQRQTARDEFLQAMKVWQDQQNKKLYAMRTQAQGQSETSARNYDIAAKSANAPDEKKRLQSLYFQQNLFDNLLLGGKLAA